MATNEPHTEETAPAPEAVTRSRGYLCVLGLVAVATAPWPFIGQPTRFAFGIPLWLWWSLGMSAVLSLVTAYGILRFWRDDDHD